MTSPPYTNSVASRGPQWGQSSKNDISGLHPQRLGRRGAAQRGAQRRYVLRGDAAAAADHTRSGVEPGTCESGVFAGADVRVELPVRALAVAQVRVTADREGGPGTERLHGLPDAARGNAVGQNRADADALQPAQRLGEGIGVRI